jgi:hypothetical protein
MCLEISSYQDQNELELENYFGSRKKFAYVYKVLWKWDIEDFYRSLIRFSFIWDFKNRKIFQVNRSHRPTKYELRYNAIDFGFHVYTNLGKAEESKGLFGIIVKFRVDKEDIVAVNNFREEAVCRELEFVKVLEN